MFHPSLCLFDDCCFCVIVSPIVRWSASYITAGPGSNWLESFMNWLLASTGEDLSFIIPFVSHLKTRPNQRPFSAPKSRAVTARLLGLHHPARAVPEIMRINWTRQQANTAPGLDCSQHVSRAAERTALQKPPATFLCGTFGSLEDCWPLGNGGVSSRPHSGVTRRPVSVIYWSFICDAGRMAINHL